MLTKTTACNFSRHLFELAGSCPMSWMVLEFHDKTTYERAMENPRKDTRDVAFFDSEVGHSESSLFERKSLMKARSETCTKPIEMCKQFFAFLI